MFPSPIPLGSLLKSNSYTSDVPPARSMPRFGGHDVYVIQHAMIATPMITRNRVNKLFFIRRHQKPPPANPLQQQKNNAFRVPFPTTHFCLLSSDFSLPH